MCRSILSFRKYFWSCSASPVIDSVCKDGSALSGTFHTGIAYKIKYQLLIVLSLNLKLGMDSRAMAVLHADIYPSPSRRMLTWRSSISSRRRLTWRSSIRSRRTLTWRSRRTLTWRSRPSRRTLSRCQWLELDPGPGKPNILNLHVQSNTCLPVFSNKWLYIRAFPHKKWHCTQSLPISSYCGKRFPPIFCEL